MVVTSWEQLTSIENPLAEAYLQMQEEYLQKLLHTADIDLESDNDEGSIRPNKKSVAGNGSENFRHTNLKKKFWKKI